MYNTNNFTGMVYVVDDVKLPKKDFGYFLAVNQGKDRESGIFMKILISGRQVEHAEKFFKKGRNFFVSGVLENSVYNDKSTLILNLADFKPINLYSKSDNNSENGNGATQPTESADHVPF